MYDVIGDVHGQYAKLYDLLQHMGYREDEAFSWAHPDGRQLVFVGDYIDRGDEIEHVLKTVKTCVEHNNAHAIMGNHEFNAMSYDTPTDTPTVEGGESFCRPHSEKNTKQYQATMEQLPLEKRMHWINWFKQLPPVWEAEGIRVVHACWNPAAIKRLQQCLQHGWTDELIRLAADKSSALYADVELVFKGLEITLPNGTHYADKEGCVRTEARVQWWRQPSKDEALGAWLMPPRIDISQPLELMEDERIVVPKKEDGICCVGHYWMPAKGEPQPLHEQVVCVDYSVAKGGYMCAYRFDGEQSARSDHFVYV